MWYTTVDVYIEDLLKEANSKIQFKIKNIPLNEIFIKVALFSIPFLKLHVK